ncbi:MAG: YidC/Oxa1 family membrane protein insertase [Candidatus Wolfebacteria bacterium]|nr:YidC/Oxa1 family membrane protein insertase [Candidatus Wolfebacteria bacterium]
MISLFNKIFYQPLFSLLVYIYNSVAFHDFGLAVIILTVIVRVILYPVFHKGAKDQAIMQRLAPKLNEIKKKHKNDKEKLAAETMRLYKEHKVNPFSQFALLILVQLPILIALFQIFSQSIKTIPNLNPQFLNLVNLANPSIILVLLAALSQYLQAKLTILPQTNQNLSKEEKLAKQMSSMTLYFMPILTVVILYKLPSAIALYWLTTTVFSVIQQVIINKSLKKNEYQPNEPNKGNN